ncbi:MAG TPA: hypothetical protein VIM17_09225 [Jatrophihabitantaceae bacterium]|jgi:hypothetical protein
MTRPTSFRLPANLLDRLDDAAASSGTSATALVTAMLDEGLKTRRFPGVVYRDGPTGRRAALAGGPDVWEVVRAVTSSSGSGQQRMRAAAKQRDLTVDRIRLAIDFYASFPGEVDERIAADERAAARVREAASRREQLFAT